MKRMLFVLLPALFCVPASYAQQENTLPEHGNVGIGTLSPAAKLDVKGNVKIDSSVVINDSATIKKALRTEGSVTFTNIGANESLENKQFMFIDENGKLHKVDKSIVAEEVALEMTLEKDCGVGDISNPLWFSGINKIFSNCPQVNVGISTNEPKFSLDVRGTTYSNKLILGDFNTDAVPVNFYLKSHLNQNTPSELFLIENADRKVFQINNNGTVKAREIIVNTQNWPDYVLVKGYKPNPLKEVEDYFFTYGHLPEVPSAAVVEAQGVNLGEMEKILLKKIEEITLYLIEQEKINSQQSELIKAQTAEIEALKQAGQK